jgi:hypothetical protein
MQRHERPTATNTFNVAVVLRSPRRFFVDPPREQRGSKPLPAQVFLHGCHCPWQHMHVDVQVKDEYLQAETKTCRKWGAACKRDLVNGGHSKNELARLRLTWKRNKEQLQAETKT